MTRDCWIVNRWVITDPNVWFTPRVFDNEDAAEKFALEEAEHESWNITLAVLVTEDK